MKLFQTNSIEIVRVCPESFGFELPSVLLTKRTEKNTDELSCNKSMFITCDKKANTLNTYHSVARRTTVFTLL